MSSGMLGQYLCFSSDSFHSICSGKTLGPGAQNFIDSERILYCKIVEPMYARFLKKCYRKFNTSLSTHPDCH